LTGIEPLKTHQSPLFRTIVFFRSFDKREWETMVVQGQERPCWWDYMVEEGDPTSSSGSTTLLAQTN